MGTTVFNFDPVFLEENRSWAWHVPEMLGCSTVCPKCRHQFSCCPPPSPAATQQCCSVNRRSLHALTGGGLITARDALAPPSPALCASSQTSPSVPIAFILPMSMPQSAETRQDTEFERLTENVRALKESGWYHEGISWKQSQELLKDAEPGTFLVRDSSDPRFLYSLSVQTPKGPTSVRLHYVNGYFRLDAEAHLVRHMPLFPSVLDLVQHYVDHTAKSQGARAFGGQVWIDAKGCVYSHIHLSKPLYCGNGVPSLRHLARVAVHRALRASSSPRLSMLPPPHTRLELPTSLVDYLAEYPYSL